MPSHETSADQLLDEMKSVVASNAETQRLLQLVLRDSTQHPKPSTASNVTINAGGLTNAIAVCVAACSVILFIVFASAMVWLYAQERGTREAWSEVYSREQAQMRAEWTQFKQEQTNARR